MQCSSMVFLENACQMVDVGETLWLRTHGKHVYGIFTPCGCTVQSSRSTRRMQKATVDEPAVTGATLVPGVVGRARAVCGRLITA